MIQNYSIHKELHRKGNPDLLRHSDIHLFPGRSTTSENRKSCHHCTLFPSEYLPLSISHTYKLHPGNCKPDYGIAEHPPVSYRKAVAWSTPPKHPDRCRTLPLLFQSDFRTDPCSSHFFLFLPSFSPLDVTLIPQEYGCSLPQPHGIWYQRHTSSLISFLSCCSAFDLAPPELSLYFFWERGHYRRAAGLPPLTDVLGVFLITTRSPSSALWLVTCIIIPHPWSWRKAATALFTAMLSRSKSKNLYPILNHGAHTVTLLRLGTYL